MKIGQYLVKLWARVRCPVFLTHGVYICRQKTTETTLSVHNSMSMCILKVATKNGKKIFIANTHVNPSTNHHLSSIDPWQHNGRQRCRFMILRFFDMLFSSTVAVSITHKQQLFNNSYRNYRNQQCVMAASAVT